MKKVNFVFNKKIKNSENRIYKNSIDEIVASNEHGFSVNAVGKEGCVDQIWVGISTDKDYVVSRSECSGRSYLSIVDLYSLDFLKKYSSRFAGYLVPTQEHQKILQSITSKPVFVFYESIDPIYNKKRVGGMHKTGDVAWFGYPESFNKSMSHLLSTIDDVLIQTGGNFQIITGGSTESLNRCKSSRLGLFDESTIAGELERIGLVILSHVPLDLQINTYIKSPNKLYSSIAAGALPICSSTPGYDLAMKRLGLSEYVYSSPNELKIILEKSLRRDLSEIINGAQVQLFKIAAESTQKNIQMFKHLANIGHHNKDVLDDISLHTIKQIFPLRVQLIELFKTLRAFL